MLTNEEKSLIKSILKKHLEEVKTMEKMPQEFQMFAAEIQYDAFIEGIIKKL